MKLLQDVTFDSLSAVREELREWFGQDGRASLHGKSQKDTRDLLLSIIIHSLAEELSDVRVRAQIHAALSELSRKIDGEKAR
ncbi:MAG: hypothetical protein QM790_05290 [Nibricoccus sp.]